MLLVVVAATMLCVLGKWAIDKRSLDEYRHFIEIRYAPQIALTENGCQMSRPKQDDDRYAWDEENEIADAVRNKLTANEIYAASWSSDGHHGLVGLKMQGEGYRHSGFPWSTSADGAHWLMFGESFDKRPLLVYHGFISDAEKQRYHIALDREAIDALMK
jgi:hypothetical protein